MYNIVPAVELSENMRVIGCKLAVLARLSQACRC